MVKVLKVLHSTNGKSILAQPHLSSPTNNFMLACDQCGCGGTENLYPHSHISHNLTDQCGCGGMENLYPHSHISLINVAVGRGISVCHLWSLARTGCMQVTSKKKNLPKLACSLKQVLQISADICRHLQVS